MLNKYMLTAFFAAVLSQGVFAALPQFEVKDNFTTMPPELEQLIPAGNRLAVKDRTYPGGAVVEKADYPQLAAGARLVSAPAKGLKWDNHINYPTLGSRLFNEDWSVKQGIRFDAYSLEATGEIITLGVLEEDAGGQERGYKLFSFRVDWQGNKTITMPFREFRQLGKDQGWKNVRAIRFFTKVSGSEPHPATGLILSKLTLLEQCGEGDTAFAAGNEKTVDGVTFCFDYYRIDAQRGQVNHPGVETANGKRITAPYAHQPYFRNERALFAYYPKFIPGFAAFDPQGRAVINCGDFVQYKDPDGRWQLSEILPPVAGWAKKKGIGKLISTYGSKWGEKAIRFDKDGDAYLLYAYQVADNSRRRGTLLLHSNDRLKSWHVYELPPDAVMTEMEKINAHNPEALQSPPVILYTGQYSANKTGYMLLPRKNQDGTLTIPAPLEYAPAPVSPAQHSGGGNSCISAGNKIFIVWGFDRQNVKNRQGEPAIPAGHPGLAQNYKYIWKPEQVMSAANGVPAYMTVYDKATGKMSDPVFLGFGGGMADNHNWPAVTIDHKGYLHVIMNGHNDPINYVRSLKPFDGSAFTAPEYIMPEGEFPGASYATFDSDRAGNLHIVCRSHNGRIINSHLGYYRRNAASGQWEKEIALVVPFKDTYQLWGHKMAYNPAADKLVLSYFSEGLARHLSRELYEFDIFYWPEHEFEYLVKGERKLPPLHRTEGFFALPSAVSMLLREPNGQWVLPVSGDFK